MIDTQGMSAPGEGNVSEVKENPPFIPKKINAFTDIEREELKQMMREVLNEESSQKIDKASD